ncbi:MAG: tRNA guanosine(34) transglycosylase Tgt [Chloroflexi bacterium]|nr:tRNA guanosine(34) transglycosylase Tgt [Chloroflexota bacterium]
MRDAQLSRSARFVTIGDLEEPVDDPDFAFRILGRCTRTAARAGELHTPHGPVATPVFMPVGTRGTVKALGPDDLQGLGAQVVLANAYHLALAPGAETVRDLGGLHAFMAWDRPILTDSGGFQIFSLSELAEVSEEGVRFRSPYDGAERFVSPESAVAAQEALGADLIMAFDDCPPGNADVAWQQRAMERTHRWAERCRAAHRQRGQALFGIVQGGTSPALRRTSARHLVGLDFPGYAIGGLSVGEPKEVTWRMVEEVVPLLPLDRPRYLMGVGTPEDLLDGIARGIDLYDCVMPTRLGRNGGVYTHRGRGSLKTTMFRLVDSPLDPDCDCQACQRFSAGYLHHLFRSREELVYRLVSIHNVRFLIRLMAAARAAILGGSFSQFRASFLAGYAPHPWPPVPLGGEGEHALPFPLAPQ